MIGKIGNIAVQGIHRAAQGLERSASAIARAGRSGSTEDMTRALVELKQHEQAAKANVKTLKTADKAIGSLLDVKA
jgi:hypothetical protein